MIKIYIFILIIILFIGLYWAGSRIASEKCRAEFAEQFSSDSNKIQISQTKEKINEETFNTSAGDIRSILHDKYTIQD